MKKQISLFLLAGFTITPQATYSSDLLHNIGSHFYPDHYQKAENVKTLLIHLIGSNFNDKTLKQMEELSFYIAQKFTELHPDTIDIENDQTSKALFHFFIVNTFINRYIPQALGRLYTQHHTPMQEQENLTENIQNAAQSLFPQFGTPFSINNTHRGIFSEFIEENLVNFISHS